MPPSPSKSPPSPPAAASTSTSTTTSASTSTSSSKPGPEASLLHRLAGPSSGKAGLGKNIDEINRIIHDASKGGAFYANEVKRDEELTRKIDKLLARKEGLFAAQSPQDTRAIEGKVDGMMTELEAGRDLTQTIVHCDLDMFYGAVELLDNPSLAGKPFGVGGGVLTTASYEARAFGVRSGMPTFIAKKLCPDFLWVPMRMGRYVEKSREVMTIFKRYDENLMIGSLDEAYLNITPYMSSHSLSADAVVSDLRAAVQKETGLTVSCGVAANCRLAKICSDINKPNGQFRLAHDRKEIVEFMRELPIRKVPGVGRVTERILQALGVKTCGDIRTHRALLYLFDKEVGLTWLLKANLGIFSNVVEPGKKEDRKSVGVESTFVHLSAKKDLLRKLEELCVDLEKDMAAAEMKGRTVTLKYKLDNFKTYTRAKTIDSYVDSKDKIFPVAKQLLLNELPLKLRLMGVRMSNLQFQGGNQDEKGIKKFYSAITSTAPSASISASTSTSTPSSSKKRKLSPAEPVTLSDSDSDSDSDSGTPTPRSPKKRVSASLPPDQEPEPALCCPVCSREMKVSNDAFNAHLDACLNGSLVRELASDQPPPRPPKAKVKGKAASSSSASGRPKDPFAAFTKKPKSYDA